MHTTLRRLGALLSLAFVMVQVRAEVDPFRLTREVVPVAQRVELTLDPAKDDYSGRTVIDLYRDRVRRRACDFPSDDNSFAWQAFARKYDTENRRAIPDYLKEENFQTLRERADRLKSKVGSATDEIANSPHGMFNRFVFLDAQDWMDAATMTELWSAIADKTEPGSRIIFRTAGATSPIETNLPDELRERFVYEKELSENLFKQDRASIYGGFHVYVFTH